MSIVQAGLSRPPIRLNTLERIRKDPDLRCIYASETGAPDIYHLVPKEQAPRLGGTIAKSVYRLTRAEKSAAKTVSLWIGKMGTPRSFMHTPTPGDSRSWGSYNESDMNEEVIKEKIGSDAYRLFGDGLFATPNTRLSLQPILDPYTQDDELVRAYTNPLAYLPNSSGARSIQQSLRFMSKFVLGYHDFENIQVPHPERPTESLSFMEHIEKYGRPSEKIIEPASKAPIPIYGVMSVLAAATSLGDIDVLGGRGKNCGLIFLRSTEEKVYGALVVKIDPGFVFSFGEGKSRKPEGNAKDIPYASVEGMIFWEKLSKEQKDEFLEVKRNALALKDPKILDYLFQREGGFGKEGISLPTRFDQAIQKYRAKLEEHLAYEARLYESDLTSYEKSRDRLIDMKGREFFEKGEYDRAFNYLEKRVEILVSEIDEPKQVLDLTFWSNFSNAHINLGAVYYSIGQFDQAIDVYQRGLKPQIALEKGLGRNPFAAHLYRNLGQAYFALDGKEKALEFYNKALEIQLAVFGENHVEVATTYNHIAAFYDSEQKHDLSIEFGEKALNIRLKNLKEQDRFVANSYHNLGQSYLKKGIYDKAFENLNKAFKIRSSILRANHPEIGLSHIAFAQLYSKQGNNVQAIVSARKAIDIAVQAFGEKHPQVADLYRQLATIYSMDNNFNQAEIALKTALSICLEVFGENHKAVIEIYRSFVNLYRSRGRQDFAIQFMEKLLQTEINVFGENHLDVADTFNNLGSTWHNVGNHQKALDPLKKALAIRLSRLGPNDPKVAMSYNQLGMLHNTREEYDQAAVCCENALRILQANYGEAHLDTAMSYNGLGKAFIGKGRLKEAMELLQKALRVRIAILGENHFDVAMTYSNLGGAYYTDKKYEKAIECYHNSIRALMALKGDHRPYLVQSYHTIGAIFHADKKYDKALEAIQKALDIERVIYGELDDRVLKTYGTLAALCNSMKDHRQEMTYLEKQRQMALKTFGPSHSVTCKINLDISRLSQNFQEQSPKPERQEIPSREELERLLAMFLGGSAAASAEEEGAFPADALAFVMNLVEGSRKSGRPEEEEKEDEKILAPQRAPFPFTLGNRGNSRAQEDDDDDDSSQTTHNLKLDLIRRSWHSSPAKVEETEEEESSNSRLQQALPGASHHQNTFIAQSMDFLIQKCRDYHTSKRGDKIHAIINLRELLQKLSMGSIPQRTVQEHVSAELNRPNNRLFDASRLRGSDVEKIFNDCFNCLKSMQQSDRVADLKSTLNPLIQACDLYHAKKRGDKVLAIEKLKQLFEQLSAGKTSQQSVMKYLSSELNRVDNPLFEASWFRKSDVRKIYEDSLEYLSNLQ